MIEQDSAVSELSEPSIPSDPDSCESTQPQPSASSQSVKTGDHEGNVLAQLRSLVSNELTTDVDPAAEWLAHQIRENFGDAVLGVLFYGSCLRKASHEGVLDFWIVVDDYDSAYCSATSSTHSRPVHALINRIAPPNVFYFEADRDGKTLRTKYGVISRRDFERDTSLSARHPYVWARFAQPARLIACRDEEARVVISEAVSESIITMVGRLVCFLPIRAGQIRFRVGAFWQLAFRLTYDSERRPESDDWIRSLYIAHDERYDEVANLAVQILTERDHFDTATAHPRAIDIGLSASKRGRQRFRWHMMRPYARAIGLVRLVKTAWTFGDWVPYVLWKLEKHTGRAIELSDRQRRHPLIYAWPIIIPILLKRNLR